MRKADAIATVITTAAPAPIVFTTGYTSRIACGIADRPNHFYMTGSMGLCAPVATGLALATGAAAVAVDGDGSLLMNPTALITAGAWAPLPLVHVLLDDGRYASTGGQATGSAHVDTVDWATAAGYRRSCVVRTRQELALAVLSAVAAADGPQFIRCAVDPSGEAPPGRIGADLAAHTRRFADYLRRSAGTTPTPVGKDH